MASSLSKLPFRGVINDTRFYTPLDTEKREIRCLRLEPGQDNDVPVCTLIQAFLADSCSSLTYEALSYCWGDVHDTVNITIQTALPAGNTLASAGHTFRITRNLDAALRSLRSVEEPRILWVDAICINQDDGAEKLSQISMMNLIFSFATRVLVWLGSGNLHTRLFTRYCELIEKLPLESSGLNLGIVDRMEEVPSATWDEWFRIVSTDDELRNRCGKMLWSPKSERQVTEYRHSWYRKIGRSISFVLSHPWFSRIWTYQEVKLARPSDEGFPTALATWGKETLMWKTFVMAVRHWLSRDTFNYMRTRMSSVLKWMQFLEIWWDPYLNRIAMTAYRGACRSNPFESPLEREFRNTARFVASDPRDKLFALLHVSPGTVSMVKQSTVYRISYDVPLHEVILNFSRSGLHLPLSIRTNNFRKVILDKDINTKDHSGVHQVDFVFGHVLRDLTTPRPGMTVGARYESWPDVSSKLRMSLLSTVTSVCDKRGFTAAWDLYWTGSTADAMSKRFEPLRQIILLSKEQSEERNDNDLLLNILCWLGVPSEHFLDWLILATIEPAIAEVLSCTVDEQMWRTWHAHKSTAVDKFDYLRRLITLRQNIASLNAFIGAWPENDPKEKLRTPSPAFFVDAHGNLLLSSCATQPGDLVVAIEGSTSLFIISPIESHVFDASKLDTEQEIWLHDDEIVHANTRYVDTHLFLGVCYCYPGTTKHHVTASKTDEDNSVPDGLSDRTDPLVEQFWKGGLLGSLAWMMGFTVGLMTMAIRQHPPRDSKSGGMGFSGLVIRLHFRVLQATCLLAGFTFLLIIASWVFLCCSLGIGLEALHKYLNMESATDASDVRIEKAREHLVDSNDSC